ncbi:hypothetical protein GCM10027296_25290 [Chitinimonas naiadis]
MHLVYDQEADEQEQEYEPHDKPATHKASLACLILSDCGTGASSTEALQKSEARNFDSPPGTAGR